MIRPTHKRWSQGGSLRTLDSRASCFRPPTVLMYTSRCARLSAISSQLLAIQCSRPFIQRLALPLCADGSFYTVCPNRYRRAKPIAENSAHLIKYPSETTEAARTAAGLCEAGVPGVSRGHRPRLQRTAIWNNAPPEDSFVTPPGRNSDRFASPTHSNRQPATDLRGRGGAKLAEFRHW
jgi:hypothetical protein